VADPARARPSALVGCLLLVSFAVADAAAEDHTVVIENMRFQPEAVAVKAGERVVWVNKDLVPHTATAGDGAFDSHDIDPGAQWSYTAAKSGDHAYACTFHPSMTGKITVQ
jgi:plastocyanin